MDKESSIKIYGLIGYPVTHSLSPVMHNAAFKELNIPAEYRLFEIKPEELEGFLLSDIPAKDIDGNLVSKKDIFGFNITIPHKVKAREILEDKFPFAKDAPRMLENLYYVKLSGAINTVKRSGNRFEYWNTDATGFLKSLSDFLGFKTKGKNVLLIGCGGAGRAITASLSWKNTGIKKIYINDINDEAINSAKKHFFSPQLPQHAYLKDRLEFISGKDIPRVVRDCHLLINASPIGMREEDSSVIDKSLLRKDLYVYDIVYNRKKETQLFKDAKSLGLQHIANGLEMLLYQGVDAFGLWMEDKKAPIEVMRQALNEAVSNTS